MNKMERWTAGLVVIALAGSAIGLEYRRYPQDSHPTQAAVEYSAPTAGPTGQVDDFEPIAAITPSQRLSCAEDNVIVIDLDARGLPEAFCQDGGN